MENRKNYNRGYIEKRSQEDTSAFGALQMRVRTIDANKAAGDKVVTQIDGYGFYAGPSNIEFALGQGILNPENGAVNIHATAWDKVKEFVDKANVHEGDTIRVYGWFKRDDYTTKEGTRRSALACTIRKVEIDFRKREDGQEPAPAPQAYTGPAPQPAPAMPEPEGFAGFDIPDELPFA